MSYTETAAARLGAAYSDVSEEEALSLSFGGILAPLLEMLLDLLMDCFAGGGSAQQALEQANRPNLRLRLGLRLRARQYGLDPDRAVKAILGCAETTTADELNGLIAEHQ